jgi:hypothetical protein
MKIKLHIERLLIDGLPVAPSGAVELRGAIETELARLMTSGELDSGLAGGRLAYLNGPRMEIRQDAAPAEIGAGIAAATYGSLFHEGGTGRR